MAELIKNSTKKFTIDTIDNYKHSDINKSLTQSNLKKAGVDKLVNIIENDQVKASINYKNNSLNLIVLDTDHHYNSVIENLENWYPKLIDNGILVGVDYSLPEQLGNNTKSAILDFCKKHELSLALNGLKFMIQRTTLRSKIKNEHSINYIIENSN